MNALEQGLTDYLCIRRNLGFQLRKVERCLRNFVAFLKVEGASYITTELALRWTTTQFAKVQPSTRTERLGMVRRFASWHSATEPRTEKEKALSRTAPLGVNQARYRPCDKLLSFLESL